MIYIFCALYAEAAGIIKKYSLKKQKPDQSLKFDVFINEDCNIRLVLTGVGIVSAAAAVSSVCTFYKVSRGDRLINIGTCAGTGQIGKVYLINRITDMGTGRTFYPDMLLKTELEERSLVTVLKPISRTDITRTANADVETAQVVAGFAAPVYDMEAAGIYAAAAYYLSPDGISFVKVISDGGQDSGAITPDTIKEIMESALPRFAEYIDLVLRETGSGNNADSTGLQSYISDLSVKLCCSETMELRLTRLIRYAELEGLDHKGIIDGMYKEGLLPVDSRKAGKQVLDEFEKRLI